MAVIVNGFLSSLSRENTDLTNGFSVSNKMAYKINPPKYCETHFIE